MSRHVDDRELDALRASTLTEKEAARIRRHLASCEACRERAESARVVAFARTQDRAREFASTARRLRLERQSGEEVVRALLRDTPPEEWPRLAEEPSMRNSGALEQLAAEVRRRLTIDTREALTLSTLATSIAETLPNDAYPAVVLAQMRAHAWKDRAHVLRYLSRTDDAMEAVTTAEERLAPFATLEHERAIVRLVRASILHDQERTDEALQDASSCRDVFLAHGDTRRYLYAGIVTGSLYYTRGQYRDAERIFRPLLEVAEKLGDSESLARLNNNLGYVLTHLDNLPAANIHFSEAVRHFNDLGMKVEATRTERGAGVLLLAKGDFHGGIRRLRDARQQFQKDGLVEEAGLCGLEIAEVLLERGEVDEAAQLARELVDEFVAARLNKRAIQAITYLHDAFEKAEATPATVRHVHSYLDALRSEPAREFTA